MLKHLIILLDDMSVAFCNVDNPFVKATPIPVDTLKAAIKYGMEENLFIHFVYPDYPLSTEYQQLIDSVFSSKIVPNSKNELGDVVVFDGWEMILDEVIEGKIAILRTKRSDLFAYYEKLDQILLHVDRLIVVITDIKDFVADDFEGYKKVLDNLRINILQKYKKNNPPQLNIVSDRLVLNRPNHCNAGVESITIAPNGNFYICPAFYYSDTGDSVGSLINGLEIKNQQLLKLEYSPLCRSCDAYQCKRCVWLNRNTTGETNVPSHEQCVVSHLEREASRMLLLELKENERFSEYLDIPQLDYLDPFERINNKQ